MSAAAVHDRPNEASRAALLSLYVVLLKTALVGESAEAAQWRTAAIEAQRRLASAPGEAAALHRDDIWSLAVKTAGRDPVVRRDETVNPTLPTLSPLTLDQLTADPFDLDGAVQTIREVASFG